MLNDLGVSLSYVFFGEGPSSISIIIHYPLAWWGWDAPHAQSLHHLLCTMYINNLYDMLMVHLKYETM